MSYLRYLKPPQKVGFAGLLAHSSGCLPTVLPRLQLNLIMTLPNMDLKKLPGAFYLSSPRHMKLIMLRTSPNKVRFSSPPTTQAHVTHWLSRLPSPDLT